MSGGSTEDFVRDLARDVPPAPPVPSLRVAFFAIVVVWTIAFAGMLVFGASTSDPTGGVPRSDPRFLLILVGLGAFAAGATVRALAGAIPGREPTAKAATGVALIGAGLVGVGGVWALVAGRPPGGDMDLGGSLMCMSHAAVLGLLPMLVASAFLARAFARKPLVAALFAATGTIAFGALAVHIVCRVGGTFHILLGHAIGPFVLGCTLAIPIGLAVRYWSRRAD